MAAKPMRAKTKKAAQKKAELTPKQQMFCREYVIDLNGTQAAIRAGYSTKTAQEQASRLLSNVMVAAEVQKLLDARAEKLGLSAERVLAEIARLSFVDIRKLFNADGTLKALTELDDDTAAAISSVEVSQELSGRDDDQKFYETKKIKLWDKKGSLELAGRHLKLFTDKKELSADDAIKTLLASLSNSSLQVSKKHGHPRSR